MPALLVVDDERSMREMLDVYLRRQGHDVTCTGSLSEGLMLLRDRRFDLVLSDLRLGKDSGLSVLDAARNHEPAAEVIMMTAFSTIETAVQAMKAGAYDYVQKPFDLDELKIVVDRALERRRLVNENDRLRAELDRHPRPGALIAQSSAMRDLLKTIDKVAAVRANVLITGESGAGKEVVAREIHARGPRRDAPFLAINCGAMPQGLIESELFGHVKGAFTGAVASHEGLFASASDGTVFLDEIGELPKDTQVKLLRVIQERRARPVGSTQDFEVQARLVAATNRELGAEVAAGRFREDLFYRLNVIHLRVPPLRDRREDVIPLAEHFLARIAVPGRQPLALSRAARARLLDLRFPGNVRELENLMERSAALVDGQEIDADLLVVPDVAPVEDGFRPHLPSDGIDIDQELLRIERAYLEQALGRTGGVKVAAAKLLRTTFRSFRYRLEKVGLKGDGGDDPEPGP